MAHVRRPSVACIPGSILTLALAAALAAPARAQCDFSIDFTTASMPSGDTFPTAVDGADFDQDGDVDLVVGHAAGVLTLLLNQGDGTLVPAPGTFSVGSAVNAVVAADLDGDGVPEVAAAGRLGLFGTGLVEVLEVTGGGFLPLVTVPLVGPEPISIAAADLDGDGDGDLAVADYLTGSATVILNGGLSGWLPFSYALPPEPTSIAAEDVDGDGDADLQVATGAPGVVALLFNDGAGTFSGLQNVSYAPGADAQSLAAGDVEGDGDVDLAVGAANQVIVLLLNDGAGSFSPHSLAWPQPQAPVEMELVDVNADGLVDLVGAGAGVGVGVLENLGAGAFAAAQAFPASSWPDSLTADDLDGDSYADLAVTSFFDGSVSLLTNETYCDYTITAGPVELELADDPEFGLVYQRLSNSSLAGPADSGADGISLARTDTWKLTLRDSTFQPPEDWVPPKSVGPCEVLPPDGLVHVRPSEVDSFPAIVLDAQDASFTATWQVNSWELSEHDEDAAGFPQEPFEVVLSGTTADDEDHVTFEMTARLTSTTPQLSIYRMELRAAVEALAEPDNQILAMPWYLGTLVPRPLESEILGAADCTVNVRLSDPERGPKVPTHPGVMTMQWLAYYETDDPEGDLFYLGTRDVGNHIKPYHLYPEPNALGFGVQYYPLNNLTAGQDDDDGDLVPDPVSFPFPLILSHRQGTWYDAAQYYRDWVFDAAQPKLWVPSEKPGQRDSEYSESVRVADALGTVALDTCALPSGSTASSLCPTPEVGLCQGMTQEHANFAHWDEEWQGFKDHFGINDIVGKIWFWDHNAFDACFGDWFDAAGAIQSDFVANVPPGDSWSPYFHPLVYCAESSSYGSSYVSGYTDVDDYVVRDEFGQPMSAELLSFPKTSANCDPATLAKWNLATLCAGTFFPLDYARHVVAQLQSQGGGLTLPGLYLDEFHAIERQCYDDAHEHAQPLYGGVLGGGSYYTDGKQFLVQELKAVLRDTAAGGDAEAYLWIEGASEKYLRWVEVCNTAYGGVFGANPLQGVGILRVPMFQTVYNEYQRFASVLPVNLPADAPQLTSASDLFQARHSFAQLAYEAGEVPMGTVLSPTLLSENLAAKPLFAQALDFHKDAMDALQTDEARDLLRFGRRLRDPATDTGYAYLPAPQTLLQGQPIDPEKPIAVDRMAKIRVPLVYASVAGEPGTRVALLLTSWTADGDAALASFLLPPVAAKGEAPSSPGAQTVQVTLDLADYGFGSGDHGDFVLTDVNGGSPKSVSWSGAPVDVSFDLPELSAQLWVIEPDAP